MRRPRGRDIDDSREGMATSKDKNIKALISGCRNGNRNDWTELIDRLSPVIFSACYRFRLSREECFDVFGKVSLLLLENLNNVRDERRIFGYVATIAGHEAAAIKSRDRMIKDRMQELEPSPQNLSEVGQETLQSEKDKELRIMSKAFIGLSQKCQELLRLLFLEADGLSYRDISRRLSIPVSSIGPTRGRCLEKLRHKMIEEGFEE
jgi:RNA polymerase sigma factor (sigma-70 family)